MAAVFGAKRRKVRMSSGAVPFPSDSTIADSIKMAPDLHMRALTWDELRARGLVDCPECRALNISL